MRDRYRGPPVIFEGTGFRGTLLSSERAVGSGAIWSEPIPEVSEGEEDASLPPLDEEVEADSPPSGGEGSAEPRVLPILPTIISDDERSEADPPVPPTPATQIDISDDDSAPAPGSGAMDVDPPADSIVAYNARRAREITRAAAMDYGPGPNFNENVVYRWTVCHANGAPLHEKRSEESKICGVLAYNDYFMGCMHSPEDDFVPLSPQGPYVLMRDQTHGTAYLQPTLGPPGPDGVRSPAPFPNIPTRAVEDIANDARV